MGSPEQTFTEEERRKLLAIARESIAAKLEKRKADYPEVTESGLLEPSAAFVTLHIRSRADDSSPGMLRGCIGTFERSQPLWEVVTEYARHAAFGDPRFPPVAARELPRIRIEISVLSPLRRLDDPLSFRLGVDGIEVEEVGGMRRRGTYLPQVATETGWDKETFLSHLCSEKAGLSPDAWRDREKVRVRAYSAEVFSE